MCMQYVQYRAFFHKALPWSEKKKIGGGIFFWRSISHQNHMKCSFIADYIKESHVWKKCGNSTKSPRVGMSDTYIFHIYFVLKISLSSGKFSYKTKKNRDDRTFGCEDIYCRVSKRSLFWNDNLPLPNN